MSLKPNQHMSWRDESLLWIVAFACLSASLVGCTGGPSESEMKAALEKAASSPFLKIEILMVKNLGCQKDGAAHVCDVEMETNAPMVGKSRNAAKIRFIKTDSGWQVTR
jgi:hypothetical protein